MGSIPQLIAQLRRIWGRLGRNRKVAMIGIGGGALAFAFIFLNMGSAPAYSTAFTNLDPKDANAAIEELKAVKIPYQLSADGSTIKVPAGQLADARLKLSAKGLPQGGAVGFELFDKTSFGVTDFVQHINYQRALEGELSRTINALAQVEGSRVHIVVPKQELFVAQQKPATASVLLRLRAGRALDENALKGISHLIARSVEGLEEKNITILDGSGKMLFDGAAVADGGLALSATQMDVQKRVEKDVEGELQSLLDRVAGPDRAAVRVKAELDFSQQEAVTETYTPGGPNNQGVARSSSSVTESFNGAGAQTGGQPGVATNLPGARVAAAQGGNSQYQKTETTTNYEVSKDTRKTVRGPGDIKRLSVSVLLDSSIGEGDAAGLRDAVAAAAGIDQRRGDQLVVTTAAFSANQNPESIPVAKPALFDTISTYAKVGVPVLVTLLVLFVVWRMSRSVNPKPMTARAMTAQPAAALGAGGGSGFALPSADALPALGSPGEGWSDLSDARRWETPEDTRRREEVRTRMTNLASANPEAVVEIIHGWMAQDDPSKKR